MNCKIPFTKDIVFEKKLYEITSISLEHELKYEEGCLKGNFIVSGDFRSHEVSVNKEAFSYILPFEIDLAHNVDESTIEFMIDDFTYQVIDGAILRVNIDFNVIASVKEEVAEESVFQDVRELFKDDDNEVEDAIVEESLSDVVEDVKEEIKEEIKEGIKEEVKEEVKEVIKEGIKEEVTEVIKEEVTEVIKEEVKEELLERNEDMSDQEKVESEDTIIESIKGIDEEYSTYHIHMVSDGESVETICTMYNSNMSILSEYNDLSELSNGDKLIIPKNNE